MPLNRSEDQMFRWVGWKTSYYVSVFLFIMILSCSTWLKGAYWSQEYHFTRGCVLKNLKNLKKSSECFSLIFMFVVQRSPSNCKQRRSPLSVGHPWHADFRCPLGLCQRGVPQRGPVTRGSIETCQMPVSRFVGVKWGWDPNASDCRLEAGDPWHGARQLRRPVIFSKLLIPPAWVVMCVWMWGDPDTCHGLEAQGGVVGWGCSMQLRGSKWAMEHGFIWRLPQHCFVFS